MPRNDAGLITFERSFGYLSYTDRLNRGLNLWTSTDSGCPRNPHENVLLFKSLTESHSLKEAPFSTVDSYTTGTLFSHIINTFLALRSVYLFERHFIILNLLHDPKQP